MSIPLQREIEYPESDGRPLGETDIHVEVASMTAYVLRQRFRDVPDVYASQNLIFYYVEGDPRAQFCPDVFLVRGVPNHQRRIYKLWEEGKAPSLLLEVTSRSTRQEDLRSKKELYERLGVEEYFLFDPLGEYLKPRLQGHRLASGRYHGLAPASDGSLLSRAAGLELIPEGHRLRLRDAQTREPLLWPWEEAEALRAAEERIRALEEEVARLRGRGTD